MEIPPERRTLLPRSFPDGTPLARCRFLVRKLGLLKFLRTALHSWEPMISLSYRSVSMRRIGRPFEVVGLMLSRECRAHCIFCPIRPGAHPPDKEKFMSLDLAARIVDDLAAHGFSGLINFGENGDALLNPEFREIISHARARLPCSRLILYTNMMNLDPDTGRFLLQKDLSSLLLNIDGAGPETYGLSKPGLDFETVRRNLHSFIETRDRLGIECPIKISVLSPHRYLELRGAGDRRGIPYDADEVVRYWQRFLSPRDSVYEPVWIFNWKNRPVGERRWNCPPPIVDELLSNLFISAEGDVYLCCFDHNTRRSLGNVLERSPYEIWSSPERRRLVRAILKKHFREVGVPCEHCNERYDHLLCLSHLMRLREESLPAAPDGVQAAGKAVPCTFPEPPGGGPEPGIPSNPPQNIPIS